MNFLLTILPIVASQGCYDDGDGRFNLRIKNYMNRQVNGNNNLYRRAQPNTFSPKIPNKQFRDLILGDINVVHVTDTHGWLSGHLNNQDLYSADWGDFVSFSEHLQKIVDDAGKDLLFVETGDRHDGTGLSDASQVDAQVSNQIFKKQMFDILSIGNHELYDAKVTDQEFNDVRPFYKTSYLSSNVEYLSLNGTWVPAGHKYKLIQTKNTKLRILAFSFLFDFKKNANNSRVTPVEQAVQEEWFQKSLNETDYDLIFVTGHMPVRDFSEFDTVVKAIREVNKTVVIQGFGGHTHLRDFRQFDNNSVALESGRYLETIGFASLNVSSNNTKFFRRYIDFNPTNLAHHTKTNLKNFTTENGLKVSQLIQSIRQNMSLDTVYGKVKKDYHTNWAEFNSSNSLFHLLATEIYPLLTSNITNRTSMPRIILGNTGSYRYPLLKGKFTLDQKYIVSPFNNPFLAALDVPLNTALQVLPHLNKDYKYIKRSVKSPKMRKFKGKGYVTHDDFGNDGDDVVHKPYKQYDIPNAFQSLQNINQNTEYVDVVFNSYLKSNIVPYLNKLGWNGSVSVYSDMIDRDVIEKYFTPRTK